MRERGYASWERAQRHMGRSGKEFWYCSGVAHRLGLQFIPSYLGHRGSVEEMLHGVNYASAGARIIFFSGSELGQRVSFTQQIQQITDTFQRFIIRMDTFQRFIIRMGEEEAASYISNLIIYISIGSNDYIHYYLWNVSAVQTKYVSWEFHQLLAYLMRLEIKNSRRYGFAVTHTACCGLGRYKGWMMCYSPGMACDNASNHLWWDQFHLTAAVNKILADNMWSGLDTRRSADSVDNMNCEYAYTSWLIKLINNVDNKGCNYDA
nr:hypothetical protein [Tanacetum cinerariifolium]